MDPEALDAALSGWDPKATTARRRATKRRPRPDAPETVHAALEGGLWVMRDGRPAAEERMRWEARAVGGGPWSGRVDPASVPVCDAHDHGQVAEDLQKLLRPRMRLEPLDPLFRVACLTEDWDGFPAGARVITYGRGTWEPWLMWVDLESAPARGQGRLDL